MCSDDKSIFTWNWKQKIKIQDLLLVQIQMNNKLNYKIKINKNSFKNKQNLYRFGKAKIFRWSIWSWFFTEGTKKQRWRFFAKRWRFFAKANKNRKTLASLASISRGRHSEVWREGDEKKNCRDSNKNWGTQEIHRSNIWPIYRIG